MSDGRTKPTFPLLGVRVGGAAFALAATVVFLVTMSGSHTHGALQVLGSNGSAGLIPANGEAAASPGDLLFLLQGATGGTHDFVIIERESPSDVVARFATGGDAGAGSANLPAGEFEIICVTKGHEAQGMSYDLIVR